ncbi:MAG: hypothetical protein AABX01_00125 [Candidatus Micrarchaeota archaeon]
MDKFTLSKNEYLANGAYYAILAFAALATYISDKRIPLWVSAPIVFDLVLGLLFILLGFTILKISRANPAFYPKDFSENIQGAIFVYGFILGIIALLTSWQEFLKLFSFEYALFFAFALGKILYVNYPPVFSDWTDFRLIFLNKIYENQIRWSTIPIFGLIGAAFFIVSITTIPALVFNSPSGDLLSFSIINVPKDDISISSLTWIVVAMAFALIGRHLKNGKAALFLILAEFGIILASYPINASPLLVFIAFIVGSIAWIGGEKFRFGTLNTGILITLFLGSILLPMYIREFGAGFVFLFTYLFYTLIYWYGYKSAANEKAVMEADN